MELPILKICGKTLTWAFTEKDREANNPSIRFFINLLILI
jgi:hypothetical protein